MQDIGSSSVLRLIYFSTARLGLGPADLENILSRAVAYNLSRGVTGSK